MVFLEQRLSKHTHTHTHIQTIHMHPYSEHCRDMHRCKCTQSVLYTHQIQTNTHTHIHRQLTFVRGLRGPAVQCSSKLWTARIRGSRALIWESRSQRHRAAVTKWRLLSWDASKTTQDFKVHWGQFVSHGCQNISTRRAHANVSGQQLEVFVSVSLS